MTSPEEQSKTFGRKILEATGWITGGYLLFAGIHEFVAHVRPYYPFYGIIKIAMGFLLTPLLRRFLKEHLEVTLSPLKTTALVIALLIALVSLHASVTIDEPSKDKIQEKKFISYDMAQKILSEERNIEPELVPLCAPNYYDLSCLLEISLGRLLKYGLEKDRAYITFINLSNEVMKSGNAELINKTLDILVRMKRETTEEEKYRNIEIIKGYFSLGRVNDGMELLKELRDEAPPSIYWKIIKLMRLALFLTPSRISISMQGA